MKSAFLNGDLEEEIYVGQPYGFVIKGQEGKIYKLKKALYGLKQAPRQWYTYIDNYFLENGFVKSKSEPTLNVKKQGMSILIVAIYVDDLIFTSNDEHMINQFKSDMMKKYEMSDMGLLHHFLGIEIHQQGDGVFICQHKYAEMMLKRFNMYGYKAMETPLGANEKLMKDDGGRKVDRTLYRSIVGSLMYLTATRPDIMFASSLLSRYMQDPSEVHLGAAKRVLRYIKGTVAYGIKYFKGEELKLISFYDSDWAGSRDDMKSTTGFVFSFDSGAFSWQSKNQDSVAQSSAEAAYVDAALATSQAIWLRRILEDIDERQRNATEMLCVNKSAISMAKNSIYNSRTRHIAVKHHFIREKIEENEIKLVYCKEIETQCLFQEFPYGAARGQADDIHNKELSQKTGQPEEKADRIHNKELSQKTGQPEEKVYNMMVTMVSKNIPCMDQDDKTARDEVEISKAADSSNNRKIVISSYFFFVLRTEVTVYHVLLAMLYWFSIWMDNYNSLTPVATKSSPHFGAHLVIIDLIAIF
ncbi:hypothetical protein AgCh_015570 [Apium graveolens]